MVTMTGGTRDSIRLSPIRIGVNNVPTGSMVAGFFVGDSDPFQVPSGASRGMAFLNTSSGDVFQLGANMQWSKVGNVRGPSGPAGTAGLTPEQVEALVTDVLAEYQPPLSGQARTIAVDENGDFYINLTDSSVPNTGSIALDDEGYPYIKIG